MYRAFKITALLGLATCQVLKSHMHLGVTLLGGGPSRLGQGHDVPQRSALGSASCTRCIPK